ncbi:hypothetical protein E1301_Tti021505 [Triplophysa tibetana]|uniref:DUF4806 domain-containing protein n=1 Tax=Triplophysa tibetana TaxID=1572043 RepID=A0A5A9NS07_9TELE|nr:hypothetical protein E1301_Tti021505 [Triplophysa tibetana]
MTLTCKVLLSVENEGSEQNCSPGHEGVEYGVIEGNCSSGQNSGIDAVSEANCSSGTEDVEMPPASRTMFLQEWSMKHLITHNAIDDLLRGLQKHGHPELPSTARTLLRTPREIKTLTIKVRMSAVQIKEVTQRLLSLRKAIPSCFPRKPRGLEDIDRWKATELRQFAVYTGKILLKGILSDQLYDHFMAFSVALSLLLSPCLAVNHNKYSTDLMTYFVAKTKDLYGEQFMVYNIHSMIHLPAEAIHFGSLDACSAFPFENFLGKIKRLVRSGKQPLVQVAKRLMEISVSPQTQSVVAAKCKLSRPNNGFILGEGKCCEAIEERVESDESGSPVMEKKTFAVVEFADDNSIEIVSTTWLEEATEYFTTSYIFSDSFEKALQKCQRATETSNIETEDTSIKKRPHKKPSRFHSENDITSDDYRTKVLQKLQELVENQQDILAMQRTILAALAPSNMADEDILDGPCQTLEDFAQLDKMLENGDKRTKMLNYLRSLGGADEGAAVRKMMRKVASTEVLSAYSLKGRKGKLAFQSLRICNIIHGVRKPSQLGSRKSRASSSRSRRSRTPQRGVRKPSQSRSKKSPASSSKYQKSVLGKLVELLDEIKRVGRHYELLNSAVHVARLETCEDFAEEEARLKERKL